MNTRLQVEHPVTEMVLGIDLVEEQIRVAAGERLRIAQEEVRPRGAAIECRLYAEDTENGFMPSPGTISRLRNGGGPGIREDSGVYEGWTVPVDYDPLLSKIIGWGATREQAIARLRRALREYEISGIRTNLPLFRAILEDADFVAGRIDTAYLTRLMAAHKDSGSADWQPIAAAVAVLAARTNGNAHPPANRPDNGMHESGWRTAARLDALRSM
jgi:acetyl-CoA carboxylase biotin carboxylase subunit